MNFFLSTVAAAFQLSIRFLGLVLRLKVLSDFAILSDLVSYKESLFEF